MKKRYLNVSDLTVKHDFDERLISEQKKMPTFLHL